MISSQPPNHGLSMMNFSSPLPPDAPSDHESTPDSVDAADSLDSSKKRVPNDLTSHGTTPSGKPRLFVCNTCTRAFARLEHLRRHERSHTKEKPFTCGVCQRKFSRRDLLLRHAQKLHAGCADAITRLRRKSVKSNSISADGHDLFDETTLSILSPYRRDSSNSTPGTSVLSSGKAGSMPTPSNSHRGSMEGVHFNLNLFNSPQSISKPKKEQPRGPGLSRSSSIKDLNLQRQLFDRRKPARNRGASFSAQSGGNYANAVDDYNGVYPVADTVEFSTPQLLPTSTSDESSWLNNLSTIPSMDGFNKKQAMRMGREDSVTSLSLDHHENHTPSYPSLMRSDSIASGGSFHNMDAATPSHPPVPLSRNNSLAGSRGGGQMNSSGMSRHSSVAEVNENEEDYGYSFYDIPENMQTKPSTTGRVNHPLSPIKQEMEDDLLDFDTSGVLDANGLNAMSIPAAITNGVNFDLNFLKDIDELTKDYDVNSRFMPNGYSFYGDNQLISSSGMDSNSPSHLSPNNPQAHGSMGSQGHIAPNQTQGQNQFQVQDPGQSQRAPPTETSKPSESSPSLSTYGFRKDKLFTKGMRLLINKSLSKYPISGIMSPTIPSNEKLEFYLSNFIDQFLSHFPFIHSSKLNEYEIMSMTSNETQNNESARVCMPLLVATVGALLANNKNDAEHLYEASRRSIHIYLESRKNTVGESNGASQSSFNSVNPLWLIQSLTLSVVYGLFSENENNVYIVIRQLNALNSLVKTSIKSNRSVLFSFNGDDDEHFNALNNPGDDSRRTSLFSSENGSHKEIMFKNSINMQSQVRIVFMIYKLTNFIFMIYNVPLTLSINDLGNLSCPSIYDEYLWQFKSYNEFKGYQDAMHSSNDVEFYIDRAQRCNSVFKQLLLRLSRNEFNPALVTQLTELSRFGFTSIVHGIYEMNQFDEMKYIDVSSILDNVTMFIDSSRNNADTRMMQSASRDYEKLDFCLLVNFIKISTWMDFKSVKEQSWLRNHDKLTTNFHQLVTSVDHINDGDLLRIVDCCISTVKLILFKLDDSNGDSNNGQQGFTQDMQFFSREGNGQGEFTPAKVLQHANNTCSGFERTIGWKALDDIDISKNSIHSQMLFHVFTILSTFAIFIAKRNHIPRECLAPEMVGTTEQLNQRFVVVLEIMARVEQFLKLKYQNSRHESDLANLFLFSSFGQDSVLGERRSEYMANEEMLRDTVQRHPHYFSYSIERSLYILKIGELILRYFYDTNIKLYVFRKLSGSVLLLRKFLIDNESRVLQ